MCSTNKLLFAMAADLMVEHSDVIVFRSFKIVRIHRAHRMGDPRNHKTHSCGQIHSAIFGINVIGFFLVCVCVFGNVLPIWIDDNAPDNEWGIGTLSIFYKLFQIMALQMEHNPLVLYIAYKYDLDQNELNGVKPRLICIKRKLILELDLPCWIKMHFANEIYYYLIRI